MTTASSLALGGLLLARGAARVAVSFTDADSPADIAAARDAGVAIAELRIDLFSRTDTAYVLEQVARLSGLPTLATIRLKAEGGAWTGSEADRIALYEALSPQVDGIDVELRATQALAVLGPRMRAAGKLLVVSHHDFTMTPPYEVLADIAQRAGQVGDIVKIAAQVNSPDDIAVLTRLLTQGPALHCVIIGMGEIGQPTRVAFPALGSLFTFAAKGARATAPGQIAYIDLIAQLADLEKTVP